MTEARSIDLAVIPGDGIGPEIITEAQRILARACELENITVTPTHYKLGAEHWLETGETLPDSTMDALKQHDAILFGAIGADPRSGKIPSGLIERELLLMLRFAFDHYINLRPSRCTPVQFLRLPTPETSTSSSCVKALKGPTSATAALSAAAPPMKSPPKSPLTPHTVWSA